MNLESPFFLIPIYKNMQLIYINNNNFMKSYMSYEIMIIV